MRRSHFETLSQAGTLFAATVAVTVMQCYVFWWDASVPLVRRHVAPMALIVGGALAYHFWVGPVEMAPSRISKLNTAMEFQLLLAVLALQAGYASDGLWWQPLLFATLAIVNPGDASTARPARGSPCRSRRRPRRPAPSQCRAAAGDSTVG